MQIGMQKVGGTPPPFLRDGMVQENGDKKHSRGKLDWENASAQPSPSFRRGPATSLRAPSGTLGLGNHSLNQHNPNVPLRGRNLSSDLFQMCLETPPPWGYLLSLLVIPETPIANIILSQRS